MQFGENVFKNIKFEQNILNQCASVYVRVVKETMPRKVFLDKFLQDFTSIITSTFRIPYYARHADDTQVAKEDVFLQVLQAHSSKQKTI